MSGKRPALHDQLLRDVEKFLERHEVSASRFGTDAVGNPNLVFDLRKGSDIHLRTADKLYRYMDAQNGRTSRRTRKTNELPETKQGTAAH